MKEERKEQWILQDIQLLILLEVPLVVLQLLHLQEEVWLLVLVRV
jgi:hypothetical protein